MANLELLAKTWELIGGGAKAGLFGIGLSFIIAIIIILIASL